MPFLYQVWMKYCIWSVKGSMKRRYSQPMCQVWSQLSWAYLLLLSYSWRIESVGMSKTPYHLSCLVKYLDSRAPSGPFYLGLRNKKLTNSWHLIMFILTLWLQVEHVGTEMVAFDAMRFLQNCSFLRHSNLAFYLWKITKINFSTIFRTFLLFIHDLPFWLQSSVVQKHAW